MCCSTSTIINTINVVPPAPTGSLWVIGGKSFFEEHFN